MGVGHLKWEILFYIGAIGCLFLRDILTHHFCVATPSDFYHNLHQTKFETCYFSTEMYYIFYALTGTFIVFIILAAIFTLVRRWNKYVEKVSK